MYGQTYLCLALSLTSAERLAAQMVDHQEPQTYLPRMPRGLDAESPLAKLAAGVAPNPVGDSDVLHLTTRGGMPFTVIAKNRKWRRDFWNDLVGPTLHADLDCETWIRGPVAPHRDSDGVHVCDDVTQIDLRPLGMPWAWPETRDHAKWAITTRRDWICVGDINRMRSQEKRGGGTVAFRDGGVKGALEDQSHLNCLGALSLPPIRFSISRNHSRTMHRTPARLCPAAQKRTRPRNPL